MGLIVKSLLLAAVVALSTANVSFNILEKWYGGFKMQFTLTADSELNGWSIDMELSGQIDSLQVRSSLARVLLPSNEWKLHDQPDHLVHCVFGGNQST